MKKKALVILSGGQDSMTCLFWAIEKFDDVEAIIFMYNQNHKVEVDQARWICLQYSVNYKIVDLTFIVTDINKSAMIEGGDTSQTLTNGLPSSFVPNRNALFITLAHTYAQKIGAQTLVAGMCQTDYSGYPDCRQIFITLISNTLNSGAATNITIETPIMYLTKGETFKMAADLGKLRDIIDYSHTCYRGDREHKHQWGYGCGTCPACVLRAKGWKEYQSMLEHSSEI